MAGLHREAGVTLLPRVRVTELHGSSQVTGATVGGRFVPADIVLLALGDSPHTGWLDGSGRDSTGVWSPTSTPGLSVRPGDRFAHRRGR